jgi:hypothetical protein
MLAPTKASAVQSSERKARGHYLDQDATILTTDAPDLLPEILPESDKYLI